MHASSKFISMLVLVVSVAACSGNADVTPSVTSTGNSTSVAAKNREGKIYRQEIKVAATGDTQVFQVFEPTKLEAGKSYPLVLQGHGYGGHRETTAAAGSFIKRLIDAGYYVISIDERGFGETSGQVRVMDPEYEGQDLVAILDWAENLEGLRRGSDGKMVVGSYGGSYGGMYQFLLMGSDQAKQRLHVIAPDITPHDLTESLNLNRVVKSGYGLVLAAGGEASPRQTAPPQPRQDPVIEEILVGAVATNAFTDAAQNFFKYHSVAYFCDGKTAGPQSFNFATPDKLSVPPAPFPAKVDALITQGFRDSLFNFNQGFENYQCMSKLGGDVRFLTHESGHILTISLSSVPPSGGLVASPVPVPSQNLESPLDPFYAAVSFPNFQDASGARNCGNLRLDDVQFGWFEEKLQGKTALAAALPSGKNICLSLGKDDAITVPTVTQGGTKYDIKASTPQFNSALGVGGALLGNGAREQMLATQAIPVPAGSVAIAGMPTMSINLAGLSGQELATCPTPVNLAGCDPILFLGIGHRAKGATRWDLIDDQLTPIRGFGDHGTAAIPQAMSGIAERLATGDEIALLIYAFHAQYPVTWSRDLLVPAVKLTGSISLPFLKASDIGSTLTGAPPALPAAPATGGGGSGGTCAPGSVPGIGGQCAPTGSLPSAPGGAGGGGLCAPGSAPGIGGQCAPV
jgi:ABC-2 type transport system ATP-binding protein